VARDRRLPLCHTGLLTSRAHGTLSQKKTRLSCVSNNQSKSHPAASKVGESVLQANGQWRPRNPEGFSLTGLQKG
jgi:hypothetical protein